MSLFGYPVAQENDSERAVRAALSIKRALAELNHQKVVIGSCLPVSLAQKCGRLAMPDYWVFSDEIVGRIRIHRAECGACKYGTGLYKVKSTEWPQVDYDWEPANTYAEACEIVAALKHSKPAFKKSAQTDCDLCHPGRHK